MTLKTRNMTYEREQGQFDFMCYSVYKYKSYFRFIKRGELICIIFFNILLLKIRIMAGERFIFCFYQLIGFNLP